jgi:hypothetical protein
MLATHAAIDVTPRQNAVAQITPPPGYVATDGGYILRSLDITNFRPHILFNGSDVTGQTNTVVVGQQISLTCAVPAPSGFPPATATIYQWTVPGIAISNFVVSPDWSSGMVNTNFSTNTANTTFYWVDGATNRQIRCNVTVAGHKLPPITTTFNVIKPSAAFIINVLSSASVDINYYNDPLAPTVPVTRSGFLIRFCELRK